MKRQYNSGLDFIIDKLTNSIESTLTGDVFYTEIVELKINKMGLIKEPRDIDFSLKSEPWTDEERSDFRKLMQDIKANNAKRKEKSLRFKGKKQSV